MVRRILPIIVSSIALGIGVLAIIPMLDISSLLSVSIESNRVLSLQTGMVSSGGTVEMTRSRQINGGKVQIVLPNDVDLKKTVIGFSGGPCTICIKSIVYKKWCIVPFRLDGYAFTRAFKIGKGVTFESNDSNACKIILDQDEGYFLPTGKNEWQIDFGDRSFLFFVIGMIGLAAMLFLLSIGTRSKKEGYNFKGLLFESGIVSMVATLLFAVVLPLQVYVPSQHAFGFGWNEFAFSIGACAIGMFSYFMIMLYLGSVGFGRFPIWLLLLLSIAVYLENGPLAIGLPELDGNLMAFVDRSRSLWDVGVWILVLAGGAFAYRYLKGLIKWIAFSLLVLVLASALDISVQKNVGRNVDGAFSSKPISHNAVIDSAVLAPTNNTMVFILDALTTEVAEDVFKKDPDLFERFKGFVLYCNNVGMHVCTELGVPGMFTGRYRSEFKSIGDYDRATFGEHSAFNEYIGDNVGCFLDIGGFVRVCWTNRPKEDENSQSIGELSRCNPFKRRMQDQQAWNLLELCLFKTVPFVLKYYVYGISFRSWPTMQSANEKVVYSKLRDMPIVANLQGTFHVYHTEGSHAPYLIDRHGNMFDGDSNCYAAVVEKGWFALSQLADLFDAFKAKGLYDEMFIVVVADHGAALAKENNFIRVGQWSCYASRPRPLLFIKPRNSVGLPRRDVRLTSHSKIRELLVESHKHNLSQDDVQKIVGVEKAIYQQEENGRFVNFVFGKDGVIGVEEVK